MEQIEPVARRAPYMVASGNHERDWPGSGGRFSAAALYDSGGECGVAYDRRFAMPGPAGAVWAAASGGFGGGGGAVVSPRNDTPWYSFDYGPMHVLQYSTEHDFAPGR
jgi:hypothetical protein